MGAVFGARNPILTPTSWTVFSFLRCRNRMKCVRAFREWTVLWQLHTTAQLPSQRFNHHILTQCCNTMVLIHPFS